MAGPVRRVERRTPWPVRIELAAAALVIVLGGFLVLGGIVELTGAAKDAGHRSGTPGALIVGAVMLAAAIWWFAHAEHRARAIRAGAPAEAAVRLRHRVYGRRGRARLALVLMPVCAVASFAAAVTEYQQGRRSIETQQHGIPALGTVIAATNTKHCGRGGCSYTATIAVELLSAVRGRSATTVHVNGSTSVSAGAPVSILVDPQDLGYAEFAGYPFTGAHEWIVFGLVSAFFALMASVLIRAAVRQRASVQSPAS